jgi:hypothetical protein
MKIFLAIILTLILSCYHSQADTSHLIKVNFLYGSRPLRKYRSIEPKYFGGMHGGHVTIQVDNKDYGFEPSKRPVHIFPHKKQRAAFRDTTLENNHPRYGPGNKTVTFYIPLTQKQYEIINSIHECYKEACPYDYAFFGMRCASTTEEILSKTGVLKKKKRFINVISTFYPKRLRKRMFRIAEKNNYKVIRTAGRPTRKWESD